MIYYKRHISILILLISTLLIASLFLCKESERENIDESFKKALDITFSEKSGFYEDAFELTISTTGGTVYYTLDGSEPNKNSIKYEEPIFITDASKNDNVYSMRMDVSTGFDKEEIEKISSDYPDYQLPDYKIDKATVIRAVAYDGKGNYGEVKSETYFVGYSKKNGYKGMKVLSVITDPDNLFDYETGIYITGEEYDKYVNKYRGAGEYYWREEFWGFWDANYRKRGIKWERKAECQFFDETGKMTLSQMCGIRIHGGVSRGYNPKSLNIYARKEYDGNKRFQADLFGTGYFPDTITLFQGGNDVRTKAKDYVISEAVQDLDVAIMNYVPYVMFLDGEYWGIYWLNEKYDARYLEYYYGVNKDNVVMIKNGELTEGDDEDIKYYTNMYEFCSKADMTESSNYERACEMIDIDSYVDYYAIMIYIARYGDWPWMNYALWRVDKTDESFYGDGKWRWMIFDLNSPGFSDDLDSVDYVMNHDEMFQNMMTNNNFSNKMMERIEELADTIFEEDRMLEILSDYQMFIEEPMRENDRRFFGDDSLSEFKKQINELSVFFKERKEYLLPMLKKYRHTF